MNVFDIPNLAGEIASHLSDDENALKTIFALSSNKESQSTIAQYCGHIRKKHALRSAIQLAIDNLETVQGTRAYGALFIDLMELVLQHADDADLIGQESIRQVSYKIDLAWLKDDLKDAATFYHNKLITLLNWAFDGHTHAPWWWRAESEMWDESYDMDESQFDW